MRQPEKKKRKFAIAQVAMGEADQVLEYRHKRDFGLLGQRIVPIRLEHAAISRYEYIQVIDAV